MPAPITAPTPRLVSCTGPRTRCRRFSPLSSSSSIPRGFFANRGLATDSTSLRFKGRLGAGGGTGLFRDLPGGEGLEGRWGEVEPIMPLDETDDRAVGEDRGHGPVPGPGADPRRVLSAQVRPWRPVLARP